MLRRRPTTVIAPALDRLARRLLGRRGESRRERAGIRTVAALEHFLRAEAALIAQKSLVGYCIVKTRLPLHELTREALFAEAFERAQQAAFRVVLEDLVVVVEGTLRAESSSHPALAAGLARLHGAMLGRESGAWDEGPAAADRLHRRLLRVQMSAPQPIAVVSRVSGERLFDSLPIHESLREPDKESVVAGVQFLTVSRLQRLDRRLEAPALARELEALANAAGAAANSD